MCVCVCVCECVYIAILYIYIYCDVRTRGGRAGPGLWKKGSHTRRRAGSGTAGSQAMEACTTRRPMSESEQKWRKPEKKLCARMCCIVLCVCV